MPPLYHENPALMPSSHRRLYNPFYLFIRKAHGFLQSRGKASMRSYALAGVAVPLGFAMMLLA